jgi:hypothetical protein
VIRGRTCSLTRRGRSTGPRLEYLTTAYARSFTVEPLVDVVGAVAPETRGTQYRDSLRNG